MNALLEPLRHGGPVVIAILGLSVILYTRCFGLLLHLREARRRLVREYVPGPNVIARLRILQDELQETFQRQRAVLGAMIAAAPLLGLLGTVTGMISTFENLSSRDGQKSMEGLADGISKALVATEAGLSVAIPAVLLVYFAHRQMQKGLQTFAQLEHRALEAR